MTVNGQQLHEAYSFVCLRCGHGWEQEYEIVHCVDPSRHEHVQYFVGAHCVPSPLTRATCPSCGGRQIRTLRYGRIDSARLYHD